MSIGIVQPLTGHTSVETAYVQADYPYGFKLRCQRRCWLERDAKRGYRFCTQTSNPKKDTLVWNAPKKSTYTHFAIMGLDEDNHVTWTGVSMYQPEVLEAFIAKYGHAFDADQAADASVMLQAYKLHLKRKEAAAEIASLGLQGKVIS